MSLHFVPQNGYPRTIQMDWDLWHHLQNQMYTMYMRIPPQTISDFKQVIYCTETRQDRIMPVSYPLASNILFRTCFFRLPASCTYLVKFFPNQPKLWKAWGRGHERSVFWQLVSAYLRQPGGRQGKVLSTGATAATDLQYFLVGNWRKFVLVMFLFSSVHSGNFDHWLNRFARKLGTHLFNWKFLRFLRYNMTSSSFSRNTPCSKWIHFWYLVQCAILYLQY